MEVSDERNDFTPQTEEEGGLRSDQGWVLQKKKKNKKKEKKEKPAP